MKKGTYIKKFRNTNDNYSERIKPDLEQTGNVAKSGRGRGGSRKTEPHRRTLSWRDWYLCWDLNNQKGLQIRERVFQAEAKVPGRVCLRKGRNQRGGHAVSGRESRALRSEGEDDGVQGCQRTAREGRPLGASIRERCDLSNVLEGNL